MLIFKKLLRLIKRESWVSFIVIKDRGITQALTSDHHFEQQDL
jgi:hypothetical protein